MAGFATSIDHVWDGQAASAFQTYGRRCADGLRGEAEVAGAVAMVLRKVSSEYGAIYESAVGIIQSIARQLEEAALTALIPFVGQADVLREVKATVSKFLEAEDLVEKARKLVGVADKAMKGLATAVKVYEKGSEGVDAAKGKYESAEGLIGAAKDAPGRAKNLAGLLHTPTHGYGGPSAPNYR